jgi:hypothetical protein
MHEGPFGHGGVPTIPPKDMNPTGWVYIHLSLKRMGLLPRPLGLMHEYC